ncbi:hypothetical protein KAFR_0A06510 [Kazachstania africana CBS 2517]|uniref:Nucleoporin NUP60 n=1 Tax=Kazachstania africana (strain ATCC 22294 / BCRC 22015 / CBS 2517 / CECT 1963 / NBRC 1671 / NRRL Y-8276) TaxID=1071382 RepID=H2ANY6_KAZAF|nr:hypothetical protein KAFR_0A06510 [Kazachstania africana CBS 2517]CCF56086.1 hypothetical protein KAFR_0A06510 [Kazachstania africana CBS 2517]
MSIKESGSFRNPKSVAPYRKPVSRVTNRKTSFMGRIKNLFTDKLNNITNTNENENSVQGGPKRSISERRSRTSNVIVPGGFFDASETTTTSIKKEEQNHDISTFVNDNVDDTINSNKRLSRFFAEKGDAPLSEIEIEGILSIINKSKQHIANDEDDDNTNLMDTTRNEQNGHHFETPKVLKSSRILSSSSNFNLPTFTPKFENSKRNVSMHSMTSSTSTTRRVFNYSNMPTPYRTVVYKYSVANTPRETKILPASNENSVRKPASVNDSKQKLSNTASALISLLDSEEKANDGSGLNVNVSNLANPYSSHISKLHKFKRPTVEKKEDIKPIEAPVVPVVEKKEVPATSNGTSSSNFNMYKPVRSSSLRSSVNAVSDEDEEDKKLQEPLEVPQEPLKVPQASAFTFKFDKKPERVEIKEDKKPSPVQPTWQTPDVSTKEGKSNSSFVPLNIKFAPKLTEEKKFSFEFEQPVNSNIDSSQIDETAVENFRSTFIF